MGVYTMFTKCAKSQTIFPHLGIYFDVKFGASRFAQTKEHLAFNLGYILLLNPSSPKGGCNNPPKSFRPGAQNRTAKG